MQQDYHIIQQQSIEIQFENLSDGSGIQNEIADFFYEHLSPRMEVLFDEFISAKYSITIDHLEIDCGVLNSRYWKEELVEQTIRRLRQELILAEKKEIKEDQFNKHDIKTFHDLDS